MSVVIVIPARYGSTRFPGKPLAKIQGKELLYRTWLIAKAVKKVDEVWVATDDDRISRQALGFGAQVLMTSENCINGSERVYQAIQSLENPPEIVINLQGDAVLTPPWVIQAVLDNIQNHSDVQIATPATLLSRDQYEEYVRLKASGRTSGTLVVFDLQFNALYFSKGLIPCVREWKGESVPVYRHIGLYAYRYGALKAFTQLKPTPLEDTEKLEQLRALENGIPIRVVPVDYRGRTHWSIDHFEDIAIAESIIRREGELV